MKVLTIQEASEWCTEAGLVARNDGTLGYKRQKERQLFLSAPDELMRIAALVRSLMTFRGEANFSGGIVWLRRWDIGSPELVRPGWCIVESIRRAHGELRDLETAPAQLFRHDEFVQMHAFLIQVTAFGWIADSVLSGSEFFFHHKDNRQMRLCCETDRTLEEIKVAFQDWSPTDEDPMIARLRTTSRMRLQRAR